MCALHGVFVSRINVHSLFWPPPMVSPPETPAQTSPLLSAVFLGDLGLIEPPPRGRVEFWITQQTVLTELTGTMSEMQVQIPEGVAPGGRLHVSIRKASAASRAPGRAVWDALVAGIAAGQRML